MKILITGGAGFIGSALIRFLINNTQCQIVNIDKLNYASNLYTLNTIDQNPRYQFYQIDICDYNQLSTIFNMTKPDVVMHLAAESHVDRSIETPRQFIDSNIIGTYNLLEISLQYWNSLEDSRKNQFRFQHISTDEVYGDLDADEPPFTENTPYKPSSPYSASKAASDHLVRAWHRTYGLPVLISNCSNNYGPYQYPEKLIPLSILNALQHKPIQIYGDGSQIRDWLHVDDHVQALLRILELGKIGETYNIGGLNERKNIDVISELCSIMDSLLNRSGENSSKNLIQYIKDRPGHDKRYAINSTKISKTLNWQPRISFSSGLRNTIEWYLNHQDWFGDKLKQKEEAL